jgi:hypothetical protein
LGNACSGGNNYAGAVLVNNGLFEMKAGSIRDNVCHLYGGGVFIGYYSHLNGGSGGIFIQSGGVISGNRSEGGGGGVSLRGSSAVFTLKDGEISGNYAVPDVKLADMYVDAISAATGASGPLEPYGGGGVFVQDGGLFEFKGGSVIGNTTTKALFGGGGILLLEKDGNDLPAMELSGGLVSGNTSSPDRGRGIYAESGKFTLSGNPSIVDAVCLQYQPQADQHILIDGDFTGTTIRLNLRGNRDGIAHISNWIKPVLGITPGGAIPAAMRGRFTLGTFTPYSGGSSVNISACSIEENGKLKH